MPFVRAHYRRPRGSKGAEFLALIFLGAIVVVVTAVYEAALIAIAFVKENAVPIGATLLSVVLAICAYFIRDALRRRSARRFVAEAEEFALNFHAQTSNGSNEVMLADWREKLDRRGDQFRDYLGQLYEGTISDVVADGKVTDEELTHLGRIEAAFALDRREIEALRLKGFLQSFAELVEDGVLTNAAEKVIDHLRVRLRISDHSIRQELDHLVELRQARAISRGAVLPAVSVAFQLQRGETCHYSCSANLPKRPRYAADSGTLFVTNKRLLFVGSTTVTAKIGNIVRCEVDAEQRQLEIALDSRKNPLLFAMDEPYFAASIVGRVVNAALEAK